MKNIIDKYHNKVLKIIKNLTGTYNEDLEQEVYIKIYKNIEKYSEQNKFSQWICAITSNMCKDYLKSKSYKNSLATDFNDEQLNQIKDNTTPEKKYSSKERQKLILKAIDELPKKQKEIIVLYEFENYSYKQIANKLKIPEGTVKSRLNSAKTTLKEKLEFLLGD